MNSVYLQAAILAVLCFSIMGVCICRLDKLSKREKLGVGLKYVVLLMAAALLALSPFLFQFNGWAVCIFAGAVLFMLLMESADWRDGPPPSSLTVDSSFPPDAASRDHNPL